MTPADKLSVARSRLLLDHPFFGVLALRLGLHEEKSIQTLATDGRKIIYNPSFVETLNLELCSSALAHEVMHNVLEHCTRRNNRHRMKWNIATDYAVNPILKEAGMRLGDTWLYEPKYEGMSADEIYDMLPDMPDEAGGGGAGPGQPSPLCDVMQADDADAEELSVEWKLATVQAAKAGAAQGSLPGTLKKILGEIISPAVPWRDVLRRFMTERARDDYSFRRPNPYFLNSGFYLPTLDGVGMGEIVIGMDTSGSVMNVIDKFGATVKDIIASCSPSRVHVIYCDAKVNLVQTFEHGQEVTFKAVGGGGTDFRPVFEHVKKESIKPACLLYLTDMYGSFPTEAPEYPVMWCATSGVVGPFGETLRIGG